MAARSASPPLLPTEGGSYELQGDTWVCIQQTVMTAAEAPAELETLAEPEPEPATTDNPED